MEGMKEPIKNGRGIAIASIILGIIGLLTVCIIIGIIPCIIGLILGIFSLVKRKGSQSMAAIGTAMSILGIILFIVIVIAVNSDFKLSSLNTNESESSESVKVKSEETVPETTVEDTTEAVETEEEFKDSCLEIGYKKILRNPGDYIGQRIVITAKVQQIVQGGLFDDGQYYRVLTDNEGYEFYADDEYFMYDNRTADDMKILKDDVIKIYAEFIGMEEVRRALTGAKEEVPAIKAYYVELISE